jgi:hypothetical protein
MLKLVKKEKSARIPNYFVPIGDKITHSAGINSAMGPWNVAFFALSVDGRLNWKRILGSTAYPS